MKSGFKWPRVVFRKRIYFENVESKFNRISSMNDFDLGLS